MRHHYCQFIIGFKCEPGEDGDPTFCEKPAPIKKNGVWLCAEHYDEVMRGPGARLRERSAAIAEWEG